MAVTDDTLFFERLLILSQCLDQKLESHGLPKPCFSGIIPGDAVVADYCSCVDGTGCGMAWVRLAGIQPSALADPTTIGFCMPPMEGIVEVGVLRCAPGIDEAGNPPTVQQQLVTARAVLADMSAALDAITCECTGFGKRDIQILNWAPLAESGGCIGGAWTFLLAQSYGQ